jgi:DNA processing protein
LSDDENTVLACFAGGALLSIDQLTAQTGLSVAALSSTLMMLELKRRVVKRTDGTFEARPA